LSVRRVLQHGQVFLVELLKTLCGVTQVF
jgi:hypothetical protein